MYQLFIKHFFGHHILCHVFQCNRHDVRYRIEIIAKGIFFFERANLGRVNSSTMLRFPGELEWHVPLASFYHGLMSLVCTLTHRSADTVKLFTFWELSQTSFISPVVHTVFYCLFYIILATSTAPCFEPRTIRSWIRYRRQTFEPLMSILFIRFLGVLAWTEHFCKNSSEKKNF